MPAREELGGDAVKALTAFGVAPTRVKVPRANKSGGDKTGRLFGKLPARSSSPAVRLGRFQPPRPPAFPLFSEGSHVAAGERWTRL